jgi:hypothetical protein
MTVEHGVLFVLHVVPVHIDLWSDWIFSFLDHFDVLICMEIVPKSVIMQVRCPNIRIIIPLNHGMILLLGEVCGPTRVTMIHSPEGVQVVRFERWNHLLNGITWFLVSMLT